MSTIVTCRNCSTRLRVADNVSADDVCPQCLTPLDDSGPPRVTRAPNVLRDVRRDSTATGWVLFVLLGLCVTGIILTCAGMPHIRQPSNEMWHIVLIGALDLGIIGCIAGLSWRIVPRWDYRGATLAVRILGLVALVIGLIVAIMIFLFALCAATVVAVFSGPMHLTRREATKPHCRVCPQCDKHLFRLQALSSP